MRPPGLVVSLLLLVSVAASVPAAAQLTQEQSPGLRVVYIDGTESYLVPHVTRTALNSLAFQKKLFGFDPATDLTVVLLDLSDAGNAGATSVPSNMVRVQIAPLGFTFETLAANERMNTIMNHELVHVVTMDQAAASDRMFRRLFGGKVMPIAEQPESILYFYLTTPRVAAPRWFHEGVAVFVDTWMAGGLGRAQSGYDEMVFRAMVRDNAPFYDPLGLVSKGTDVDFQLEINSYLYGTRFMTWLARRYSPDKVIDWTARREGSRGYYASQFKQVFGVSLEEAWARVDRGRADVSAGESGGDSQVSDHAASRRHDARARVGVARIFRSGLQKDLRRLQLSRRGRARRRHRYRQRQRRADPADQGPADLQRHVPGVGSRRRARCSTPPTTARIATW